MKRVTKKERQLYDLLERVSGLLSNPEIYGARFYYAMTGSEAREELIKNIEGVLEPYRELQGVESEAEYQADLEREYLEG